MDTDRQLHLVLDARPASGGEGLAALRYAQSLAQAGASVTLLATQVQQTQPAHALGAGTLALQALPTGGFAPLAWLRAYQFMRQLCREQRVGLVHLHGMWSPLLLVGARVAKALGLPLVISPHGCLEPWALAFKAAKKRLALQTYQGAILRQAALLVATAQQELDSLRRLGLAQPVAVIPIGVDLPPPLPLTPRDGLRTLLFLSRVHPKKGLPDLVQAWAQVRPDGWRVMVAGADEDGHLRQVQALVQTHGLQDSFSFAGFVDGERKRQCFAEADLFILPSHSENFGIAIAEALAHGVPVITTTATPWQILETERCGWWVPPGVNGITEALRTALACPPQTLQHMGQRGRQLVASHFSWAHAGQQALQASRWLADPRLPPPGMVATTGHTVPREAA